MPPKPKTADQIQAFRNQIIDAARELFFERGVDAVTMREIAKRIDYSATSIYSHFADKEAVLRAVCDTDFLLLAEKQKQMLAIADPQERLMALGKGYMAFALNNPSHYRLMFMTPHAPCGPESSSLQQNNPEQDAYFQLKMIVQSLYDAKRFKPHLQDIDLITQTIWASMHGLCALEIIMGKDTWVSWCDVEARLEMTQQLITNGLMKENNEH